MTIRLTALPLLLLLSAACTPAREDGIDPEGKAFDGVAAEDTVTLTGTEPFWNLKVANGEGVWSTPENPDGTRLALGRFAGNGGLGFSGMLDGKAFTATLTPGECSDGMSDRTYPFVATIALDGETLQGCGYTDSQPFAGPEAP